MASAFPMKVINFSSATEKFKYKFPYDASSNTIDNIISRSNGTIHLRAISDRKRPYSAKLRLKYG